MKIFSTFSGIGGFEVGIENAYRSKSLSEVKQDRQGRDGVALKGRDDVLSRYKPPLFVGYSEIDKYASAVYQKQFGGRNYGDITKINAEELPDFDCIVGGFPCQAFSIAGKRKGFEDTRGTLFFDLARILRAKRPRLFVFENVKGLLSHNNGNTFTTIIATIDELGYDAQWQVVNSKNHGVPQNRERIIIVGHLRGTPRPQIFPLETNYAPTDELSGQPANTLTTRYYPGQANGTYVVERKLDAQGIERLNNPIHSTDRVYSPDGISPALSTMQGGGRQPYVALDRDRLAESSSPDTARVRETARIPRLLDGEKFVSDSQRYKMAGNAVTTNVIQAVFERIFESEAANL